MGQKVSPVVAVVAILVVAAIAFFVVTKLGGGQVAGSKEGEQPPGMPPSVAQEFQKRGAAMNGPGQQNTQPGGAPTAPGTAPTAPASH